MFRGSTGGSSGFTACTEEGFSVIESGSPDLKVANLLREFGMKSYDRHLQSAETVRERRRRSR
jgi:hypothetical protein